MIFSNFEQKLRKLNSRLRVFKTHDSSKGPWGLYLMGKYGEELEHVCGVSSSNGFIYELTERRWDGYILRQGWRRVLKILISKKLVDKRKAGSLFSTLFEGNRGKGITIEKDPLTRAMNEAKERGLAKTGVENYVEVDDMIDIHRMREQFRKDKTNYWA